MLKESDDLVILGVTFDYIGSSAVWCWAADTHLKQLDRVFSRACFLTFRCV